MLPRAHEKARPLGCDRGWGSPQTLVSGAFAAFRFAISHHPHLFRLVFLCSSRFEWSSGGGSRRSNLTVATMMATGSKRKAAIARQSNHAGNVTSVVNQAQRTTAAKPMAGCNAKIRRKTCPAAPVIGNRQTLAIPANIVLAIADISILRAAAADAVYGETASPGPPAAGSLLPQPCFVVTRRRGPMVHYTAAGV